MALTPFRASLAPSATTLTDMHTCAAEVGEVGMLTVANRSATPTSFRVSIAVDGAADATSQYLRYDRSILGNAEHTVGGIALTADDVVRVYAGAATLTFTLSGIQIPD